MLWVLIILLLFVIVQICINVLRKFFLNKSDVSQIRLNDSKRTKYSKYEKNIELNDILRDKLIESRFSNQEDVVEFISDILSDTKNLEQLSNSRSDIIKEWNKLVYEKPIKNKKDLINTIKILVDEKKIPE